MHTLPTAFTPTDNLRVVTQRAEPLLRRMFQRRLPAIPYCQQDVPELVNRALEIMVEILETYNSALGSFSAWLFHYCALPVLKEYLRARHYRLVELTTYRQILERKLKGQTLSLHSALERWVGQRTLGDCEIELNRVRVLQTEGRQHLSLCLKPTLCPLAEDLTSPAPSLEQLHYQTRLHCEIQRLPTKERLVVQGLFFQGHSQTHLATHLQLSNVRIHQLKKQALHRLGIALGRDFRI